MEFVIENMNGPPLIPGDLLRSYRTNLEKDLGFVAESRQMKQLKDDLVEFYQAKGPCVIAGPRGTGRTAMAKAIHLLGTDWWRPFIEDDLSHIPEEAALKNLLGFEEGHLFSSPEYKPGLFSLAQNSTLCLKNFDKYARKLQDIIVSTIAAGEYKSFTGNKKFDVNCRIFVTMYQEPAFLKKAGILSEAVANGFERVISIPPLAKRKDDIIPLTEKFIGVCCAEFGIPEKKLSKDAEKWLKKAPWRGNVSQLKRAVFGACMNTKELTLLPEHFALAHDGNIEEYQNKQLDELSIQSVVGAKLESFLGRLGNYETNDVYEAVISRVEEPLLKLVLNHSKGNQIRAARLLGINRNTLRTKLKKYDIKGRA